MSTITPDILQLDRIEEYQEGHQIEAKAAQGGLPDTLWDTYSAFANTDGGCILLGVKENKDHSLFAVGLNDAVKMVKDFWNMVNNRQKISVNLMTEQRVRIEKVNGKEIILLEVPRAERTSRPVFKGLDPRTGTYRRNEEGDYLCSLEEVSAMFRDAAISTQDAKVLKEMHTTVFCEETVSSYRQMFRLAHPNHEWNRLENEVFLRRIGATSVGDDGLYHPTAAGLLMFGYEYEILRESPQYFLDYQENRQMSTNRWTDRIVSSSGEWSGNIFDFVYKVVPKLTSDLKVPFVLKGVQRMDDTPVHKILREAVINACAHADFYGCRGLVIRKNTDGFIFENPGNMRVAKKEAVEGGVSDPRNGVILKIFSLINYGERAGSGLSSIFNVWKHVYYTSAVIREETGVDRVSLSLQNDGHAQDVNAMLELYDNPDELKFSSVEMSDIMSEKQKMSDIKALKGKIRKELSDKAKMSDKMSDKMTDIVVLAIQEEYISTSLVALRLGLDKRNARRYLARLVEFGYLSPEGTNKSKRYRSIVVLQ